MISFDEGALLTLLLMYFRVTAIVFVLPFFGTFNLPNSIKVYLSFALAVSIFLFADVEQVQVNTLAEFLLMALRELSFSFLSAFMLRLMFDAITIAGEIVAVNSGLGFAMMFLPQQPQMTVLAGFSTFLGSAIFVSLGGPEILYVALADSFRTFPIGSFDIYSLRGEMILDMFYASFALAFRLALPVLITAMITNIILAIVNRFIPQINVFMVGMPLQIVVGLVTLMIAMPILGLVITNHMKKVLREFLIFM